MELAIRPSDPNSETDTLPFNGDERAMLVRVTVGDLVRLQRKTLNIRITQEELAFRSGISFEHLNHIENYRAKVSIEVLDRIALALGFSRLSEFLAHDYKCIL